MKIFIYLFLIFQFHLGISQSKITETEKLVATCKVWGFLKYYHPKVANGDFNWDEKLFEVLPKIEKANSKGEFSLILENWIDSLGGIKQIEPIVTPKDVQYFDKNFDLSWFNDKLFSKKLIQKLKYIEGNRFRGKQFYIDKFEAGNVFAKNENKINIDIVEKKNRLLLLFRYWSIIEYFYPYKYLMDNKWDKTLVEMLQKIINTKSSEGLQIVMKKISVKLNDSHSLFSIASNENNDLHQLPVHCQIIDEKLVVNKIINDSLAIKDDIKIGDIITNINGKTIKEIINEEKENICASNNAFYLSYLSKFMTLWNGDKVDFEILRDNRIIQKTIDWNETREDRSHLLKKAINITEKFKFFQNNIGYVDMGKLKVKDVTNMTNAFKQTKAIIFDLRNYPDDTYEDISKFLNSKKASFVVYTIPDLTYPGKFIWTEAENTGSNNENYYKGKVIVLLNENSISQSEWTAMCLQTAPNVTIIGSQTAGADGNTTDFECMKGFTTHFTGIGVYYPDRRETQRIGIVPDIEVKPTIKGIQEGRDEVLDRALQFIETGK